MLQLKLQAYHLPRTTIKHCHDKDTMTYTICYRIYMIRLILLEEVWTYSQYTIDYQIIYHFLRRVTRVLMIQRIATQTTVQQTLPSKLVLTPTCV